MRDDALVALDGPANFRDLGGHPTRAGGVVRTGRVFRSDSLSYLSDADLRVLRDQLGIRTVIDLRAPHEVAEHGHGPLSSSVRQLHLPIVDQTRGPPGGYRAGDPPPRFGTLEEIYGFMLSEYAERVGAVLQEIATIDAHPLVFHCAAGKDRTGLVAALVLAVCEVPDEEIVADFAFTEARMPTIIARHTQRAELGDRAAEVAGQQYGAPPATMTAVLARLRAEHGDLVGYVRRTGLDDAALGRLRHVLVEGP